jgi:hypothetical protein
MESTNKAGSWSRWNTHNKSAAHLLAKELVPQREMLNVSAVIFRNVRHVETVGCVLDDSSEEEERMSNERMNQQNQGGQGGQQGDQQNQTNKPGQGGQQGGQGGQRQSGQHDR